MGKRFLFGNDRLILRDMPTSRPHFVFLICFCFFLFDSQKIVRMPLPIINGDFESEEEVAGGKWGEEQKEKSNGREALEGEFN